MAGGTQEWKRGRKWGPGGRRRPAMACRLAVDLRGHRGAHEVRAGDRAGVVRKSRSSAAVANRGIQDHPQRYCPGWGSGRGGRVASPAFHFSTLTVPRQHRRLPLAARRGLPRAFMWIPLRADAASPRGLTPGSRARLVGMTNPPSRVPSRSPPPARCSGPWVQRPGGVRRDAGSLEDNEESERARDAALAATPRPALAHPRARESTHCVANLAAAARLLTPGRTRRCSTAWDPRRSRRLHGPDRRAQAARDARRRAPGGGSLRRWTSRPRPPR